jgi:hypothetical protein
MTITTTNMTTTTTTKNNSIQFFIIYMLSQQLQGQLETQHCVHTVTLWTSTK